MAGDSRALPWLTAFSPNWISSTALQQWWGIKSPFLARTKNKNKDTADELPAGRRKEEQRSETTFLQTDSLSLKLQEVWHLVHFLHLLKSDAASVWQSTTTKQKIWLFLREWCQTLMCTQRQQRKKMTDGVDFGRKSVLYYKSKCIKSI